MGVGYFGDVGCYSQSVGFSQDSEVYMSQCGNYAGKKWGRFPRPGVGTGYRVFGDLCFQDATTQSIVYEIWGAFGTTTTSTTPDPCAIFRPDGSSNVTSNVTTNATVLRLLFEKDKLDVDDGSFHEAMHRILYHEQRVDLPWRVPPGDSPPVYPPNANASHGNETANESNISVAVGENSTNVTLRDWCLARLAATTSIIVSTEQGASTSAPNGTEKICRVVRAPVVRAYSRQI